MQDSWGNALDAQNSASEAASTSKEQARGCDPKQEPWADDDSGDESDKADNNELEDSNWLDLIEKSEKSSPKNNKSNFSQSNLQNTSFLHGVELPIGEKELNPDEPNTTFFKDQSNKKEEPRTQTRTRGNRNNNPDSHNSETVKDVPKRGNRQPPENHQAPRRGNRQRNEEEQEQRQGGWRNNRGNREGQEHAQPKRGNRDTYGGGEFKKKEYYQSHESQYDRGNGGNRGYRGGYRGRGGNNNYRGNNPRYREKSEQDNAGQEKPRYQQRQYGNRNYQQNNNRYENHGYNDNYGRHSRYNNEPNNFSQPPPIEFNPPQPQAIQLQTGNSTISQTHRLPPKGRKCWPEASLHILGCRFVLTARQLSDFRCKLLIMPYSTIQMEYYPGNVVNSSSVDYRKKITNKGKEIESPGAVYLQKALNVYTFEAIAFVKVSPDSIQQSLKKGITEVLKLAEKIDKPITLESLVFPICQQLENPNWVIGPFLSQLQNCRKVREVWVTTIDGKCYTNAMDAFNQHMEKLFKFNQIFLN